jgi:hypothetical protein
MFSLTKMFTFNHLKAVSFSNQRLIKHSLLNFSRIIPIKLGDLGEGTKEAEIKKWYLKVGDKVEEEDQVVEVGTDKLVADIPSPITGRVHKINYEVGQICLVGQNLCEVMADEDPNEIISTEKIDSDTIIPFEKCKLKY